MKQDDLCKQIGIFTVLSKYAMPIQNIKKFLYFAKK